MEEVAGDELAKMRDRTGISVEALSELGYAAGQSGSSAEEFEKAVKKMSQVLIDGERGLSTSTDAIDALGLSLEQLLALDPEQQFLTIAKALAAIEDPTRRAAVAQMVFGRVGTRLLPLINDGIEGIDALRQAARDMGLVISTDSAKRAEVLGDRLDDIKMVARAAAFAVGDALAPAMIDAAKRLIALVVAGNKWVQANKAVVAVAFKVAVAVTAAGAAITSLGFALIGMGAVVGFVIGSIKLLLGVTAAMLGLLASLVSPIGLVGVAFAAAAGVILVNSKSAGAALLWLRDRFGELAQAASEMFGVIAEALSKGAVREAANVLWAGLKLAWTQGTTRLSRIWNSMLVSMLLALNHFYQEVLAGTRIIATLFVGPQLNALPPWLKALVEAVTAVENAKLPTDLVKPETIGRVALGSASRVSEAQKKLNEAQAAYDAAVSAAKDAPGIFSDGIRSSMKDILDGLGVAMGGVKARGTFSGAAARDLGVGVEEKQLKALESVAANTKKIARNTEDGGLAFE